MSEVSSLFDALSEASLLRLEDVCSHFEQARQDGRPPRIEDALDNLSEVERPAFLRELLRLEVYYRQQAGQAVSARDYQTRFPEATAVISAILPVTPQPETVDESPPAGPTPPCETVDDVPPAGSTAPDATRAPAGRFVIQHHHASGNLGDVFVAEDTELHREVALKEIKQTQAHHSESRRRFLIEGEVTGRLEHPGVVPVYGLGAYPDGRPYYAMRFIRGEELAAAIKRFHGGKSVSYDGLEFRQLLGRFVAVCQAVADVSTLGRSQV